MCKTTTYFKYLLFFYLFIANAYAFALQNPPTITSITRQTPAVSPTNADAVVFRIRFNESVVNVGASDFEIIGTTANAINVSGSGQVYDITVAGGNLANLNAEISLELTAGQDIENNSGVALMDTTPGFEQTYIIDNEGAIASVPDMDADSDSGVLNTDNITNTTTPTFTGTTEEDSTVELFDENLNSLGTAMVNNSGTYSITVSALSEGMHSISARATDALGNIGETSEALTIEIDTTRPILTIDDMIANDNVVNSMEDESVVVTGTVTGVEDEEIVRVVFFDGSNPLVIVGAPVNGGVWESTPANISNLNSGSIELRADVSDVAGNSGLSIAVIELDNIAPTITINSPIAGNNTVDAAEADTVVISGTTQDVENDEIVTVTFSDGDTPAVQAMAMVTDGAWTATAADISGLNEGAITVTANVTDAADNPAEEASASVVLETETRHITLSVDTNSINESAGSALLTATLNEISGSDVTVTLAYSGSATSGLDYNSNASATITITSGELLANAAVAIEAIDDTAIETNETIVVDVTNVSNAVEEGNFQQETITIIDNDVLATVTTNDATNIDVTSADFGGEVTDSGSTNVTERGIVYALTSNNSNPQIAGDNVIQVPNGSGLGTFSETITELMPSASYSYAAYAINSSGVSYGTVKVVTTATLNITTQAQNTSVGLYPNPVKNKLNIKVENSTIKNLVLYTVLGKAVLQLEAKANTIDFSNVKSGIYLLEIETDQSRIYKKIVKE